MLHGWSGGPRGLPRGARGRPVALVAGGDPRGGDDRAQAGTAAGGGRGAPELPGEERPRQAARPGPGDPRLAATGGGADRRRHRAPERDTRWHAVRAGGDERLDDRGAAHGAAGARRDPRGPRGGPDQVDTLASFTLGRAWRRRNLLSRRRNAPPRSRQPRA